jgi:hypothetical protein
LDIAATGRAAEGHYDVFADLATTKEWLVMDRAALPPHLSLTGTTALVFCGVFVGVLTGCHHHPRREEPVSMLESLLADRWIVPKDPTSGLRPGLALVPGGGYRDDCYLSKEIRQSQSWVEYEGHHDQIRKGGLALRLLSLIGLSLDLDHFKSADIKTWGWNSFQPINLEPILASPGCVGQGSLPMYWAVGEVLVFDSLELTLIDKSGHTLNLKSQSDLSSISAKGDSLHWEVSDSNRLHARGRGLAVAYHGIAWEVVSNHECADDFSTLFRGMRTVCNPADASMLSIGVDSVDRDGKYFLVARDDSQQHSHEQRTALRAGQRWDLDGTALRWTRVFLEASENGMPYVRFRYVVTLYKTRPLLTTASLSSGAMDSLNVIRRN